jgi:hypothetical protein
MHYRGSCHCGKVAFGVEGDIQQAYSCNCSLCSRRGSLLWFAPRKDFRLLRGEDCLSNYQFNKRVIQHRFCRHCGIQSFAWGKDPGGNEMAAINLRCLENFDVDKVSVTHIDGRDS